MNRQVDQKETLSAEPLATKTLVGADGTADVILDGANFNPRSKVRRRSSLSIKLLVLTTLFVMLAEVLIFVPTVANFRINWLKGKLATAEIASIVFISDRDLAVAPDVQTQLLTATSADVIVVRENGESRLLARSSMPPSINVTVDVDNWTVWKAIGDAFGTLLASENRSLRVVGAMTTRDGELEVLINENPLRDAMWTYARNVMLISIVISLFTAGLVFLSIHWLMIRPVHKLLGNIFKFAAEPDNANNIMQPSLRKDEIGATELELASMQMQVQDTLRQRERLVALGLAVSKINHDLRNILASASLFSDRLSDVPDPSVQKFAPRIVRALDRAVDYTQAVLSYGKAQDSPPSIRRINLYSLVDEVRDLLALDGSIEFHNLIEPNLEINADPDQLFRVIYNLCRNASQILEGEQDALIVKRISVGSSISDTSVSIFIGDSGPGVPDRAKSNLFKAFQGSVRPGGTGLGLAIAAELINAHGGTIRLLEDGETRGPIDSSHSGACFIMELPNAC